MSEHHLSETPQQEGFVRRLLFRWCALDLQAGRCESSFPYTGRKLTVSDMRALVDYAKRLGFLK